MGRHRSSRSTETETPDGSGRSRVWILAAFCALALIAAWLVLPGQGTRVADSDGSGSASQDAMTTWKPTTPDPEVDQSDDPTGSPEPTAVSVGIPSINLDSPLVPLAVDPSSGTLVPPERYDVAGVFTSGPVPGEIGPAIIAGHVDSRAGPAVFYRLEEVIIGAAISVTLSDGQVIDFQVVEVAQYPKIAFPTAAVYGPTPGRELRLITCGGGFDRSLSSYLDNIVVYALRV